MQERVAIITGGSSGIGREIVQLCTQKGYECYSFDMAASATAGNEIRVDISSPADVNRAVAEVLDRHGRIDALFNNAGMLGKPEKFHRLSMADWERVLSVNLTGTFLMSQAVLPSMLEAGHGSIVNTSSIAGLVAGGGSAAYSASKAGILGLTRSMAYEYGPLGIRVNAIAPGGTKTSLADHVRVNGKHPNELQQHRMEHTPLRRLADPVEVARVAAFLASEEASFVTGAVWTADGGWTAS